MSGFESLSDSLDSVYVYDGGLAGFYCCVYESIYTKKMPVSIMTVKDQLTLLGQNYIETDMVKAEKVRNSIVNKISKRVLTLIENVFLSCMKDKEIAMLRFLIRAYKEGEKIVYNLGDQDVSVLLKTERHLLGERHLFLGFARFSDYDGILVSKISPKNFVLPFLANHFICRFRNESFIIYDETYNMALVYKDKKASIVPVDHIDFLKISQDEERYRNLWKRFYNTVAVEGRYNPKLRMSHMPKRYWGNMIEMMDLL